MEFPGEQVPWSVCILLCHCFLRSSTHRGSQYTDKKVGDIFPIVDLTPTGHVITEAYLYYFTVLIKLYRSSHNPFSLFLPVHLHCWSFITHCQPSYWICLLIIMPFSTSAILLSHDYQIHLLAKSGYVTFLFKILQGLQIVYRTRIWNPKCDISVQVHWKIEPKTKTFIHMVNLESDCLELGPSWSRCDLWCFWAAAFNSWCFHYDPFPLPWCLATHQLTV